MGGKTSVTFASGLDFMAATMVAAGQEPDDALADICRVWNSIVAHNNKLGVRPADINRTGVLALQREFCQALLLESSVTDGRPIDTETKERYRRIVGLITNFGKETLEMRHDSLWNAVSRSLTSRGFPATRVDGLKSFFVASPATTVKAGKAERAASPPGVAEYVARPLNGEEVQLQGLLERYRMVWDALKTAIIAQSTVKDPTMALFGISVDVPLWSCAASQFQEHMTAAKVEAVHIQALAPAGVQPTAKQATNAAYFKQMEDVHAQRCMLLTRVSRRAPTRASERDDSGYER